MWKPKFLLFKIGHIQIGQVTKFGILESTFRVAELQIITADDVGLWSIRFFWKQVQFSLCKPSPIILKWKFDNHPLVTYVDKISEWKAFVGRILWNLVKLDSNTTLRIFEVETWKFLWPVVGQGSIFKPSHWSKIGLHPF